MKDDYSDKTQLNSSGSIVLQFDRSSGAQKPDANGKYCSRIWIQKKQHRKGYHDIQGDRQGGM